MSATETTEILLSDVKQLKLDPGATLVAYLPPGCRTSEDMLDRIRATFRQHWPDNTVIVLEHGADIGVITPA